MFARTPWNRTQAFGCLSVRRVAAEIRRRVPAFADFMEIKIENRRVIPAPYRLVREEVECDTVAVLYERRSVIACVLPLSSFPPLPGNWDVFPSILVGLVAGAPILPIHLEMIHKFRHASGEVLLTQIPRVGHGRRRGKPPCRGHVRAFVEMNQFCIIFGDTFF